MRGESASARSSSPSSCTSTRADHAQLARSIDRARPADRRPARPRSAAARPRRRRAPRRPGSGSRTNSLRRTGRSTRLPDRAQVVEAALEKALVGQHADRRCAVGLIGLRPALRVQVGAERALARRGALDLGDQRDAGRAQRSGQVARRGRRVRPARPRAKGLSLPWRGDLLLFPVQDLVQDCLFFHVTSCPIRSISLPPR